MTAKEEREEITALRDEVRHWRWEAKKAIAKRDEAVERADRIERPHVEVRKGETWWRVYVNDVYTEGRETEEVANIVADRLRKAFAMTGKATK